MPDDHSELEPPLPIPNRAVKRLSADDSADYPCESRTSSGTHKAEGPSRKVWGLLLLRCLPRVLLERSDNRPRDSRARDCACIGPKSRGRFHSGRVGSNVVVTLHPSRQLTFALCAAHVAALAVLFATTVPTALKGALALCITV